MVLLNFSRKLCRFCCYSSNDLCSFDSNLVGSRAELVLIGGPNVGLCWGLGSYDWFYWFRLSLLFFMSFETLPFVFMVLIRDQRFGSFDHNVWFFWGGEVKRQPYWF